MPSFVFGVGQGADSAGMPPVFVGLALLGIIDRMAGIRQRALAKLTSTPVQPSQEAE